MKHILCASLLLTIIMNSANAAMPGGISDNEKPATDDLNKMLEPIKPALQVQFSKLSANGSAEPVVAVSYKTQVVAGLNYFIKFRVGKTDEYFHARVFRGLDGKVELVKVIGPKKESDPLLHFN